MKKSLIRLSYIALVAPLPFFSYFIVDLLMEMTGGKIGDFVQSTFGIRTRWLVLILFIFSLAALAFQVYEKSKEGKEKEIYFTWDEITRGANKLWKDVISEFEAECLLMLSIEGAIIASYSLTQASKLIPTYFAMIEDKNGAKLKSVPQEHLVISTNKWNTYIPKSLIKEKHKRLLIIDSQVITGATKKVVVEFLEKKGFQKGNIFFASFVCSELAIKSNLGSDYCVYKIKGSEVGFPWGQWINEKIRRD